MSLIVLSEAFCSSELCLGLQWILLLRDAEAPPRTTWWWPLAAVSSLSAPPLSFGLQTETISKAEMNEGTVLPETKCFKSFFPQIHLPN